MKIKLNEKGEGAVIPVISIAVVTFACYVAYLFGMPHYKYDSLKSEVKQIARLGGTQQKTLEMVYDKVQELDLPIEKGKIEVKVENKRVSVKTAWSVKVDVLGFYQKDLDFKIDETQ
ncbi:MAG: hypothetical protein HQL06_06525 [Nitrospirae bacterium]|nr:hypothetical protein [Nitrospirota bacterium]